MNSLRFFWKKFHLKQVKLKCIFSVRYYNWKVLSFYSDHWGRINSLDFFFLLFCFWCWNQTTSTKTNLSIKKKNKAVQTLKILNSLKNLNKMWQILFILHYFLFLSCCCSIIFSIYSTSPPSFMHSPKHQVCCKSHAISQNNLTQCVQYFL